MEYLINQESIYNSVSSNYYISDQSNPDNNANDNVKDNTNNNDNDNTKYDANDNSNNNDDNSSNNDVTNRYTGITFSSIFTNDSLTRHNFTETQLYSHDLVKANHYIENKIYILVPIYNFDKFLRKCLDSMLIQQYSNWMAILYNDGSTDASKIVCQRYVMSHKKHFKLVNIPNNFGPAATKFNGMRYINGIANNNDIMMIVDGDDYLISQDVFSTINNTYLRTKCWFTFGSFEGKWSNQTVDIPRSTKSFDFRNSPWRYGHPRSARCHLLKHFNETDFKYKGKWLTKCTDRPFVYNICEWSGVNRIQFIPHVIYYYRDHPNNTYKNVSTRFKQEQLEYIGSIDAKKQIIEPIHNVMCCWKRNNLLQAILQNQNNQTVASRIHLHILNNNPSEKTTIDKIVKNFKNTKPRIKIDVNHFDNTLFGFQRFQYIKTELLPKYATDYVIMIDDDQQFSNDWIENMYAIREPLTFKSWWGTAFTSTNYWQRRHTIDNQFDYGGTGGSIIDASIFLPNTKLWDVPVDPMVYNIEDLWLSFVIRHHYGWRVMCSFMPPILKNEAFRGTDTVAQHKTLRDKKQLLLMYLIEKRNWKFINNCPIKPIQGSIYASSNNKHWIVKKNNEIHYSES